MKYLRTYKLFESISYIRNEIEDILTEISHLGYEISFYIGKHFYPERYNEIKVFIEKHKYFKPTQEFVDSLNHLISWADENKFVYSITSNKNGALFRQYKSSEDIESITQEDIDYIKIIFRLSRSISES